MSKILEDEDYIKIFIEVSNKYEKVDLAILKKVTQLEEDKLTLGRRRGVFEELKSIINRHIDREGV